MPGARRSTLTDVYAKPTEKNNVSRIPRQAANRRARVQAQADLERTLWRASNWHSDRRKVPHRSSPTSRYCSLPCHSLMRRSRGLCSAYRVSGRRTTPRVVEKICEDPLRQLGERSRCCRCCRRWPVEQDSRADTPMNAARTKALWLLSQLPRVSRPNAGL